MFVDTAERNLHAYEIGSGACILIPTEMEVGSGFLGRGRVRVGPGSGRVSGLTFQREIGLNRGHTS